MNRRDIIKLAIGSAAVVAAAPIAAFNVPAKLHWWGASGFMFTRRGPWLIAVGRAHYDGPYWAERDIVCKHIEDRRFVFRLTFPGELILDDRDKMVEIIVGMADGAYYDYCYRADTANGLLIPKALADQL